MTPLREEHEVIIRQLGLVRNSIEEASPVSPVRLQELIDGLGAQLEAHFNHEQQTLYNPLKSALGKDSPASPMLEGHKAMRRAYKELVSALAHREVRPSSQAQQALQSGIDSLQRLIKEYVRKEEKIIFWIAELNLLA